MSTSFLVETALLTHGLRSIDNDTLIKLWPWKHKCIAWLDKGHIIIGDMKEFIQFRNRSEELIRIDKNLLSQAYENKLSGALTASGTMEVANEKGIKLVVTAGMGGIGNIIGEEICADLPAIENMDITLISTSPKDVIDIEKTIQWLLNHGVSIYGKDKDYIDGFMINSKPIKITGKYNGQKLDTGTLLLNPISNHKRLKNKEIIDKAKEAGKKAEQEGQYYHPAANAMIDKLSKGESSRLQLESLIENSIWANELGL